MRAAIWVFGVVTSPFLLFIVHWIKISPLSALTHFTDYVLLVTRSLSYVLLASFWTIFQLYIAFYALQCFSYSMSSALVAKPDSSENVFELLPGLWRSHPFWSHPSQTFPGALREYDDSCEQPTDHKCLRFSMLSVRSKPLHVLYQYGLTNFTSTVSN